MYLCYVTVCELKDVVRDVMIPWNPDTQRINVTTDSTVGSEKLVYVWFYDKYGGRAGGVYISFDTRIEYALGGCSSRFTPFPVTVPTETQKTWTITYNTTELRVVLQAAMEYKWRTC